VVKSKSLNHKGSQSTSLRDTKGKTQKTNFFNSPKFSASK
jgi:hypothetical protein